MPVGFKLLFPKLLCRAHNAAARALRLDEADATPWQDYEAVRNATVVSCVEFDAQATQVRNPAAQVVFDGRFSNASHIEYL